MKDLTARPPDFCGFLPGRVNLRFLTLIQPSKRYNRAAAEMASQGPSIMRGSVKQSKEQTTLTAYSTPLYFSSRPSPHRTKFQ
jgi:hypothetical protein